MKKQVILTVQSEARAISADMRELYENFKSGKTLREDADTLANISGKNLKAIAIMLADQFRTDEMLRISSSQHQIETK